MKYKWFDKGAYISKYAERYVTNSFDPKQIKKIAVIRHAALGDQVITRPFLVEARKFFPNAEITLVSVSNYQYGTPSDLVDKVVVQIGKDIKNNHSAYERYQNIKSLGAQDIIFDLANTNRSLWMTALNSAKIKVGFPYKNTTKGLIYDIAIFRSDLQPEVDCLLDMLKVFGHQPSYPLDFAYPSNLEVVNTEKPYIVYFNGASDPVKTLPKENMYELIDSATESLSQYTHIFLEGVKEDEKGDFYSALKDKHNFKIQGCNSLDELIEFIAKASLVVCPDTGVRNVAISTHTPTVGLFFVTTPFRYTPYYEPQHKVAMNPDSSLPSKQQIEDLMVSLLQ